MLIGPNVSNPLGICQLLSFCPPSSQKYTPPSFAIHNRPAICLSSSLFLLKGLPSLDGFNVISKSGVNAIACGSTCMNTRLSCTPDLCATEASMPSNRCHDALSVGVPSDTCTWLLSEKNNRNPLVVVLAETKQLPLGVVAPEYTGGPGSNAHCARPLFNSNRLKSPTHTLASPASRLQSVLTSVPSGTSPL